MEIERNGYKGIYTMASYLAITRHTKMDRQALCEIHDDEFDSWIFLRNYPKA